jgi:hypothetical protein
VEWWSGAHWLSTQQPSQLVKEIDHLQVVDVLFLHGFLFALSAIGSWSVTGGGLKYLRLWVAVEDECLRQRTSRGFHSSAAWRRTLVEVRWENERATSC